MAPAVLLNTPTPGPRRANFMANTESSAPAHPSTRVTRGIALANEQADRIWRVFPHTWEVPSCTGTGTYIVRTDRGTCDCPDIALACKHAVAVEIVASRPPSAFSGLPMIRAIAVGVVFATPFCLYLIVFPA